MQIPSEKGDLLLNLKCLADVGGSILECKNNSRAIVIELYRTRGLGSVWPTFFRSRFSEATNSPAVWDGPAVWPFFTSSSVCFSRASTTRRCAGVYSSSADAARHDQFALGCDDDGHILEGSSLVRRQAWVLPLRGRAGIAGAVPCIQIRYPALRGEYLLSTSNSLSAAGIGFAPLVRICLLVHRCP